MMGDKPVIVEIGAHVGSDTVEFATLFRDGDIYAIEPVPDNFERLNFKLKNFNNVKAFQFAISDDVSEGRQEMYLCSNGCSGSLLKPKEHLEYFPDATFDENLSVPTKSFLNFISENNLSHIDLLWIDVQGMELRILKSLADSISKIHLIYTEVSNKEFYEGGAQYVELKEYLEKNNFQTIASDIEEGQVMGNVLFENTQFKKR